LVETEQQLHHLLHLRFLSAAVPGDGHFDLCGRVLDDGQAGFDGGEHRDAARVAEHERAPHVARVEQAFYRDAVGRRRSEEFRESLVNGEEPIGQAGGGRAGQRAARHESMPRAVRVHAAIAGTDGTGIDPDDSHASEASISFSSMSTFDHTFFVSSLSSSASISLSICWAGLPSSLM
jgi:hypothetical protein